MSEDEDLTAALHRAVRTDRVAPSGGHRAARRSAGRRSALAVAGGAGVLAAVLVGVPLVVAQQQGGPEPAPVATRAADPVPRPTSEPTAPTTVPTTVPTTAPTTVPTNVPTAADPTVAPPSSVPTADAPPAPVPAAPSDAPVPTAGADPGTPPLPLEPGVSPADLPSEAPAVHGGRYWAVFLAVAYDDSDPRLDESLEQVARLGYAGGVGEVGCTDGASETLGLDPDRTYLGTSLFFGSREDAQAFVDAFAPGVVGTAEVTAYCMD